MTPTKRRRTTTTTICENVINFFDTQSFIFPTLRTERSADKKWVTVKGTWSEGKLFCKSLSLNLSTFESNLRHT